MKVKDGLKPIGAAQALIQKVQNTVDGGLRVSIDLASGIENIEIAQKLLKLAAENTQVYVSFVEVPE